MSVLITVPTYETVSTETYRALWEQEDCGHEVWFDAVKGYDCALARIKCCEAAIDAGADYVWMVDSDTVPPGDALANMVGDAVDVCLGYYQWKIKGEPGETCLWKQGGWIERFKAAELRAMADAGKDIVRAQGGGMGCALIRVTALERLPKPWFKWEVRADGTETGEDIYFANLCKKAGIRIWADTRAACGHVYKEYHGV